jgi:phosphomannomutase
MELFGTAGVRGGVDRVRPELAVRVGRAAARAADGAAFVVGRDGRTTGDGLAAAVTAGLTAGGADVRRVGVVPTPALAFASRGRHGAMVTASHNPPGDNGLKLFADGVEYDAAREERVTAAVEDDAQADWAAWGTVDRERPLDDYCAGVVDYARRHGAALDGLRTVVDCGNGVAAGATPRVLRELGARAVALNANVDGHFPGRASKPTRESLADLRAFLADDDEAALGIAHDGDADRIVVLDGDGAVVDRNTVLAILAEHYVRANDAADPVVVTTPDASTRIDERVAAAGGRVERVRLGAIHEGVAASDGTVVFAAEPWKHLHPAWGGWIDGVASAAVFARLVAASGLVALREPVAERPYRKLSVDCPDDRTERVMADLRERLPEAFPEAEATFDHGIRLDRPDGSWVLVRPSGTEPKVRVYVESEEIEALAERATAQVAEAVDRAGRSRDQE